MRKITQQASAAFESLTPFKLDNTEVKIKAFEKGNPSWAELLLHGNRIAEIHKTPRRTILRITDAGWRTNTTKERLNGLKGVEIHQKKGIWYLNGKEWNGKLTEIEIKKNTIDLFILTGDENIESWESNELDEISLDDLIHKQFKTEKEKKTYIEELYSLYKSSKFNYIILDEDEYWLLTGDID